MSNLPTTTKAIIAIVSIIILASGIYVLTKSRPVETPSIATSSSSVSSLISISSKAALLLSSQSLAISSSSQAVSKTIEVTKPSEVATVSQPQALCNQTDSPDLVKTEDGCFRIGYGVDASFIFKGTGVNLMPGQQEKIDEDRLYQTTQNISILKEMATDMYKRIHTNKKVVGDIVINFTDSKKTDQGFLITGGVQAFYYREGYNTGNNPFSFVEDISSQYLIYNSGNNNWNWKFISLKQ